MQYLLLLVIFAVAGAALLPGGLYPAQLNASAAASASCIAVRHTPTASRRRAMVQLYSDDDPVLMWDVSAAVTEMMAARASPEAGREWRLCVEWADEEEEELEAEIEQEVLPDHPTTPVRDGNQLLHLSALAPPSLGLTESGEGYAVQVNSLPDAAANASACSSPAGECNLRSAVAYCETISGSLNGPCVVKLPAAQTLCMDPGLGHIEIDPLTAGEIALEGNGCEVTTLPHDMKSGRLLYVDASSTLSLFISDLTVSQFGDDDLSGGAMFIEGPTALTLLNVKFLETRGFDGGAMWINGNDKVSILNCMFINTHARNGGALYFLYNNKGVSISRTVFRNSTAITDGGAIFLEENNDHFSITDCSFEHSSAGTFGGALFLYGHNNGLIVSNSTFTDTTAWYGGAISLYQYNTDFNIMNCTFESCHSGNKGGAIFIHLGNSNGMIRNSVFYETTAVSYGGALFIYSNNDRLAVADCIIWRASSGYDGGAIYVDWANDIFLLTGSTIVGSASQNGGAIYFNQDNENVTITACKFSNITSSINGGALYFVSSSQFLLLNNCSFLDIRSGNGGAVFFEDVNNNVAIENCRFVNTFAEYLGGAVYLHADNDKLTISSCTFHNVAGQSGGAIYLASWNNDMLVSDCSFSRVSSSADGGAVYVNTLNYFLRIVRCSFNDVKSGSDGGAVYLYASNVEAEISSCTFRDTVSTDDGGAIYLQEFNFNSVLYDCEFDSVSATDHGGSIYLHESNDGFSISDCRFSDSSASSGGAVFIQEFNNFVTISGSVFERTLANGEGGAVFLYANNYDLLVLDSMFTDTAAAFDGGAIYIYTGNHDVTVNGCRFVGANAVFEGGGIFLYSDNSRFVLVDSTFRRTTAYYGGGLFIYVDNKNAVLSEVLFESTIAHFGGGVYVGNDNSRIVFHEVTLVQNHATGDGAGVLVQNRNDNILFSYCTLDGNAAEGYGGGVAIVTANTGLVFESCTFYGNMASSGGAVHASVGNAALTISYCRVDNNSASFGGGMYIGDYHEIVTWNNVVFEGNIGDFGGAVYITQFNSAIEFIETTVKWNSASTEAGGIYVLSEDLKLLRCRFLENEAGRSGGISSRAKTLVVDTCTVTGNIGHSSFGGGVFEAAVVVTVIDSHFTNNSASSGGALGVIGCEEVVIRSTRFTDNSASLIDGGAFMSFASNLNISNCTFERNSAAQNGGAVYIISADRVQITNTNFYGNVASVGGGSGIWVSEALITSIFGNNLESNHALDGGGTIFWLSATMPEPSLVTTSNTFTASNKALYGPFVATEMTHLGLDPKNNYYITDYTAAIPHVVAYAEDFYNQVVRTKSLSVVAASVLSTTQCYKSSGYVTGGFVQQFDAGAVNFTTLLAFCDPGYSMPVYLTATGGDEGSMQTSFVLSFRDCVRGEYFADSICTPCEHGTYSVTEPASITSLSALSQQNVCRRCPDGADACYGDNVVLSEGYWRISEVATSTLRCPYDDNCKGGDGTGDELCSDGYEGPVCGVCSDGYSFRSSTQQCEPCSESAGLDAVTILFIVLVGLIGAITIYCFNSSTFRAKVQTVDDFYILIFSTFGLLETSVQGSPDEVRIKAGTIRRQFQARVKIYVTLWQIFSLLPFTLDLNFPHAYEAIAAVLNVFNLGISVSSLVTCTSVSFDAIDNLVFNTVYPLVVVLALWGLRTVHLYLKRSQEPASLALISGRYFNVFLMFTYLILPFVSVSIFQTFSCADVDPDDVEPGDDRYMSVDYSVSCASSKYEFGFIWAIVFILVYPVGVPLLYFYVLYSSRSEIMSRTVENVGETLVPLNARLNSVKLLFEHYQPRLWYWEVLETIQRLLLTGILVVIAQGSGVQIVVGTVATLFFLKIYDVYEPYVDSTVQMLREVCQWQIFFGFFLALLLKADFESVDRSALDGLLVVAMTMNIVVDVSQAVWGRYCLPRMGDDPPKDDLVDMECDKEGSLSEHSVTSNPMVSAEKRRETHTDDWDATGQEQGISMSSVSSMPSMVHSSSPSSS